MQTETIKIIEDLIFWLHDLKVKYYGQRKMTSVEESEYLELMKIMDKAHSLIEAVKHNARAKHYIEED
jgi:protein associated with RNAse G/E